MEILRDKMKRLNFSKEYLKKLLRGKKLMTIRRGKRKFEIGEEVEVYCSGEKLGKIKITKVQIKKFSEINSEDIKKDGFRSKRKLKKALRKHYKNVKASDLFTLIEFEWIERKENGSV
ncbi:MAG: ASCH domain-containing protein [Candidatus Aenigmarchaeota archaeon]|nr:ASCH domain-containing protein [Candidatus Aenigmarchaeota archaeon]